jgi:hypothetical protein
MLETRTTLNCAILALRRAISKLVSFSRCFPTPRVRKIFLATIVIDSPPSTAPAEIDGAFNMNTAELQPVRGSGSNRWGNATNG